MVGIRKARPTEARKMVPSRSRRLIPKRHEGSTRLPGGASARMRPRATVSNPRGASESIDGSATGPSSAPLLAVPSGSLPSLIGSYR